MNRPCFSFFFFLAHSYIGLICCIWTLRVCVWATLHVFLFRVILTYVLLSDIHQLILTMFNHPNRISGLKVNVLSHNICRHAFVRINTDIVGSWQELSMAQVRCFFFFSSTFYVDFCVAIFCFCFTFESNRILLLDLFVVLFAAVAWSLVYGRFVREFIWYYWPYILQRWVYSAVISLHEII